MINQPTHTKHPGWKIALAVVLVLILIGVSVPQVRASLGAWLGLSVAPSNEAPVVPSTIKAVASSAPAVTTPQFPGSPTQVDPEILLPVVSTGNSPDLSQVSSQVGWDILTPGYLPGSYQFQSAYFDTNQELLSLTYLINRPLPNATDPSLSTSKTITLLQALKNDFIPMQIAPGTNVVDVLVNGLPAVYSEGAWDTEFVKDENAPGGGRLVSTWRDDLAVKNIFWQDGNVYLVLLTDDEAVSQQHLLDMADSIGK